MLEIQIIKQERSYLGIKVRALVQSLKECESLNTFESAFKADLKRFKKTNGVDPDVAYRTNIRNQYSAHETLEILHNDFIVIQVYKK